VGVPVSVGAARFIAWAGVDATELAVGGEEAAGAEARAEEGATTADVADGAVVGPCPRPSMATGAPATGSLMYMQTRTRR
jgi:hypothetical protein